MVSIAKSLCPGAERRSRGRPPSENSKVTSSQSILHFVNEMHLPVKGTRRRCAYCITKEGISKLSVLIDYTLLIG